MTTVEGATDVQVEKQVLIPQVRFNVNRTEAARYGLQPGEVAETLETALNGRKVSEAVEGSAATMWSCALTTPHATASTP